MSLFARYGDTSSQSKQRQAAFNSISVIEDHNRPFTAGLTYSVSPRVVNELRTNYTNDRIAAKFVGDTFQGGSVPNSDLLTNTFKFPAGYNLDNSLLAVGITGGPTFNIGKNATNEQRQINVVDSVSLSIGKHAIKAGVDYRWLSPIGDIHTYFESLTFSGVSGGPGTLISGIAQTASIQSLQPLTLLSKNLSLFAQDTWKAGVRLTVTYGLRWDVNPPLRSKNENQPLLAVNSVANPTALALQPPGAPLYDTKYRNIAPRLGIAYVVHRGSGSDTVIRGGGGLFYDFALGGALGSINGTYPYNVARVLSGVAVPLTAAQTVPPVVTSISPVTSPILVTDPHLLTPRTAEWNLAVEQGIGANQTISLTYIGAKGYDLLRTYYLALPNPNFRSLLSVTDNSGESGYNALQIQFKRRLSHGLQSLAGYTWGHSIDNSSDASTFLTPPSVSSAGVDRGDSAFDIRHVFSGTLSYDLPGHYDASLWKGILGGWSLAPYFIGQSGPPLNVTSSPVLIAGAYFQPRPNLLAGVPDYLYGSQYPGGKVLNSTIDSARPGCRGPFCQPASGQQGSLGRNSLRSFGAWQLDLSLRREFRLAERLRIDFRADVFNILNHPNFGPPVGDLSSALFGMSTQTLAGSLGSGGQNGGFSPLYQLGGPRSIQLSLRLVF